MEDFRPETFAQFIKTQKPIWVLKIIWIGSILFLVILFIATFKNRQDAFWGYFTFIMIGLSGQALFFYYTAYKIYTYGRKAYLDLGHQKVIILNNVGVCIRGFDPLSKQSVFIPNLSAVIYDFDNADVLIGNTSIVLLGKAAQPGSMSYASPVEILLNNKMTTVSSAKMLGWLEQQGRIVLAIKDDFYNEPLKIEFKDHLDQIRIWLLRIMPIANSSI